MKVTVDQAFWELFPTARITVMSLYGIDGQGCQASMGIYR